ncbi:helix-turn-helix domain-containing protein [Aliarcobacter butzleri]|uniref:helix-turn-helix domain-containing protein n=1 Tax=Aliarcobacter TaxID=2321111 RepID=UPI0036F490D8
MEKRYVRAKELAQYLNVGLSTVWHYVKIGKIKSIKISKKVTLFNIEEVEKDLLRK